MTLSIDTVMCCFECNHPNPATYDMLFFAALLCGKKVMFSLNENNRIVMAQHTCDMRIGVNAMCVTGCAWSASIWPTEMSMCLWTRAAKS